MVVDYSEGEAQALWYIAREYAEIRPASAAEPKSGEVRVRAIHSALSRGTERLVFAGQVPASEFERMRAPFMDGTFPFPVKYGYSVVGRVEAGELRDRIVFALHPHQSVFTLPVEAAVPVPECVPAARAVLAANMETALNAVWDAAPGPSDRIAVVGAGVVGLLVGWLCGRLPGAEVRIVDIEPSRAALAERLGIGFAAPDLALGECDLVFHASGTGAGLATALRLAGDEARVVELSWYGTREVTLPLGGAFHSRRLKLISSQVGQVAPSHRARWSRRRRLSAALALLADPCLDALIAPAVAFCDLPGKLAEILAPESGILCQLIDYPAGQSAAPS